MQDPISYHAAAYQNPNVHYINHWNKEDWALKNWELNTRLKPSLPKYSYVFGSLKRNLSDLVFPSERYEAFSWAAQSYSYATGAEGTTDGIFDLGSSYDLTGEYGGLHPGHSAQWRSTLHRRVDYWLRFMDQMLYEE